MSNSYVRKTDNPNMGWSDERKAEYSAQCKVARANGTWHKKSKKAVGLAISNGKKEAIKRRNRSEGQKRRHQESNVKIGHSVKVIKEILATPPPKVDDQANIKRVQAGFDVGKLEANVKKIGKKVPVKRMSSVIDLLDLIKEHLGVRPDLSEFIDNAVEDKLAKFKEALCR